MKSVRIRGSVMAAVASIFVLGCGVTAPVHAQQSALAANPELAAKGVWAPGTTYALDDIVTARGSAWISLRNNNTNKVPGQTQPSTAAFWQLFARGFNPLGAWSNTVTYQPDDLVTFNGQTFRAKRTQPTPHQPAANAFWELLVTKGADGATGAQGPAGPNTGVGTGSQSVPAISFDNDPDTGIFSPEAGKIALVEDGVLFLHNKGTFSAALGLNALASITSGFGNTALGQAALASTTTGGDNTGVGFGALAGNVSGNNNTGIGRNALANNTSGGGNTGIGQSALAANLNGANNTAIGRLALASNATGGSNTAVGFNALQANTTSDNTAVGSNALTATTTGTRNTAMGSLSLSSNTSGQRNIAIGVQALTTSTTGDNNIAIGDAALRFATTGADNIAVGTNALAVNTTGASNTAVGSSALAGNTIGISNVALGLSALAVNTSGDNNTALGSSTLTSNTTGNNNTAVGIAALVNNTTGINNTVLGRNALAFNQTGSGNIAIGSNAGSNATNQPASGIFIGNTGLTTDTNTIKIGTAGAQNSAFIAGIRNVTTTLNDAIAVVISSTGQLGTQSSSRRYKYDIETMADVSAMLGKLRPVTFRYKQAQDNGAHPLQYGLIAEEVAETFPDLAVFNTDGGAETVKYHLLPSFLLAGYQVQQNTIAAQEQKIEALAAREQQRVEQITALEQRLRRLEALLPQGRAAALQ